MHDQVVGGQCDAQHPVGIPLPNRPGPPLQLVSQPGHHLPPAVTVADISVDAQEEFVEWARFKDDRRRYSEGYARRILGVGQAAMNRAWKRQEITQVP